MKENEIIEAACSIRPYLRELIPEDAELVDQELSQHLNQAQAGTSNTNAVLGILRRHEPTRQWVFEFLEQHQPPAVTRAFSFQPPLGNPVPVAARKYVCPQGDYTWYRLSAGTPIPPCPTHALKLAAAP